MALALYRKYRPKKLEDLVGHETNVTLLKNAAKSGRLGQAYLFYGPRGTGKTSTARLLAKLVNCEKRRTDEKFKSLGEPCNECRSCREIDEARALDVIEIDAASNRGIDEIRNLKESVRTAPAIGPTKVYIIDEAHMLTGPAFNALLKTLEEPPAHAMFVLATTELEKVPATIASRTQRFLFRKLPKVHILTKLTRIVKEEKITIEPAALELIAAAGEGSFRDAESLLEQVVSLEKKVSLASVEQLLGRVGLQKIEYLAEKIVAKDLKGALVAVTALQDEGVHIAEFTKDLIHYFRKILTLAMSPESEAILGLDLTKEELDRVKQFAKKHDPKIHIPFLKALIRAYAEMRYSPFASVPLEIALVEHLS